MQLRQLAAIKTRQHDRTARIACRRSDQPIDQARGLDLVAPAERLDNALHMATALAGVLDQVEVFVGSNLLDADKHSAAPCSSQQHHDSLRHCKQNPMASALPAVATRGHGPAEIIEAGSTGFLLERDDWDGFVAAVLP